MNKKPIILGIESSCDETAASIITENEQGKPIILLFFIYLLYTSFLYWDCIINKK